MAADAFFEWLVLDVFGFAPAKVFAHLFLTLIFSWITTGLLWVALTTRVPRKFEIERWDRLSLGAVEVGIVLGLQDILFLAFVVQVR